jgi:hypothetical protein
MVEEGGGRGGLTMVPEKVAYYTFYREALPFLGADKSQDRRNDDASYEGCIGPSRVGGA